MKTKYIDAIMLKKMYIQAKHSLESNKDIVDALNVFPVPDGDTGTNMTLTINAAAKEVQEASKITIESISEAAANGSLMGARGNSGVILSQLFRGFAKGCKGKDKLNVHDFAYALKNASDTAYKAVMKPIEGTILTVAREIGEKAVELSKKEDNITDFLHKIIQHGEIVLSKTPEMLKVLKQAGVVDAGGKGLIYIFMGFYEAISGKEVDIAPAKESQTIQLHKEETVEDITFGYCTEFIINGTNISIEGFKKKIGKYGDCMLVVGDEKLVKVHIHTNHPGKVLEHGLEEGSLVNIKIDNMRQQHSNKIFEENTSAADDPVDGKKFGMIAVAMGEGLVDIFKDLNVDVVIAGGQTMNPSTEEIKKAIDAIEADNIFIYPNNSNIIMAANQAKALSSKNVIVIPSKSVPQGIASILAYNSELSAEENEKLMTNVLQRVKTGQVTFSVRDTQIDSIIIKKDDILGIHNGNIKSVGNNIEFVSKELLNHMITEDDEILTIFYGEEVDEQAANALAEEIKEIHDHIDVEVYYGGQPLYYYLFSIE
ncbi:MAG: DAK2 domain-containing protein [Bacillota bacterium]